MADEEKKEKDQKPSSTQNKEKDQKSSSNSTKDSMESILEKMETMSLELAELRAKKDEQENHPVPALVESPAHWWEDKTKTILAAVLAVVIMFFAAMFVKDWYDHQLRLSYDAGWQAGKSNGIDAAKKQWEDTAWYSRWWNAIKGTYPE